MEVDVRTIDEASYNALVNQVNGGRGVVPYANHYEYCPHAYGRTMTRLLAFEQRATCNCGLAEFVLRAFGEIK